MNCLNNLLVGTGAGDGVGIGAEIKVGTRLGPEVKLQDGTREVSPK